MTNMKRVLRLLQRGGIAVALASSMLGPLGAEELKIWTKPSYDPKKTEWFEKQIHPGTGKPCCSIADGVVLKSDEIRQTANGVEVLLDVGIEPETIDRAWFPVPTDSYLTTPNEIGAPVVFYERALGWIKCFSPAPNG